MVWEILPGWTLWLKKKINKKKPKLGEEDHFTIESSLSEKMEWGKVSNKPCGRQKAKGTSKSCKQETNKGLITDSFTWAELSLKMTAIQLAWVCSTEPWLLKEHRNRWSCTHSVQSHTTSPQPEPAALGKDIKQPANKSQDLCLQSCHRFRLPQAFSSLEEC